MGWGVGVGKGSEGPRGGERLWRSPTLPPPQPTPVSSGKENVRKKQRRAAPLHSPPAQTQKATPSGAPSQPALPCLPAPIPLRQGCRQESPHLAQPRGSCGRSALISRNPFCGWSKWAGALSRALAALPFLSWLLRPPPILTPSRIFSLNSGQTGR